MPDRESHRQYRQTERQRYAQKTDADIRKRCGQHRAAASAEDQPKGTEELCTVGFQIVPP